MSLLEYANIKHLIQEWYNCDFFLSCRAVLLWFTGWTDQIRRVLYVLKSRHNIHSFQWLILFRIATDTADILRYLMTYLDHPNWNERERLEHKDFNLSRYRIRTWIRIRNEDKWSPSLDLFSWISVVTAFLNFWNPSIISWVMAIFIFLIFQI